MGGLGSGRVNCWSKRHFVEDMLELNIKDILQASLVGIQRQVTLKWNQANKTVKEATISYVRDYLAIDCEGQTRHIGVATTPAGYGGIRHWLLCPSCSQRRSSLYWYDCTLTCRTCLGLVYKGQHETKVDQLRRKARKVRTKLGGSDNLLEPIEHRPKYMHHDTYKRLKEEEQFIRSQIFSELSGFIRPKNFQT